MADAMGDLDGRDAPHGKVPGMPRVPEAGGRVVSKVVTHRAALGGWETALAEGMSPTDFSAETRAMIGRVRKTRERVDWDDYIEMMDRIHEIAGTSGEMTRMFSTHQAVMPELARVAKLLLNPRQLYRFLVYTF